MTERPDLMLEPAAAQAPPAPESATLAGSASGGALVGDPLSDVLHAIRLSGAVFFAIDASFPWAAELPDGALIAPAVLPSAQHVISYHVVTRGQCWAALPGSQPIQLVCGDVLVLPQGHAYWMSLTAAAPAASDGSAELAFLRQMSRGELPFCVRDGGGGTEQVGLICGFLGCDLLPFNPLLRSLPSLWCVRQAAAARDSRLGRLMAFALEEASQPSAGGESVRLRLSELLFIELVRQQLAAQPSGQTNWLAALRDPEVARALELLHEQFAGAWSVDTLAKRAGVSRTVLAERFTHLVGLAPMQYLAHWRMQVAARLLVDGSAKVAAVALAVGYESEAAFSRAFKKLTGVSPSVWRARQRPERA